LHAYPFPADHAVLALVHLARPRRYAEFVYAYATLWFTSSFFLASIGVLALIVIILLVVIAARGGGWDDDRERMTVSVIRVLTDAGHIARALLASFIETAFA
jgi:hypothetical protein